MGWLDDCKDCGRKISKGSIRCITCSNKSRRKYDIPRWKRLNRIEYQKWYMKNIYREKKKESDRKHQWRIKGEIYELLGRKCTICGYTGLALQIDHVNNDGNKDNRLGSCKFIRMLREIKDGSTNYQLLCANCNFEKELLRRRGNSL